MKKIYKSLLKEKCKKLTRRRQENSCTRQKPSPNALRSLFHIINLEKKHFLWDRKREKLWRLKSWSQIRLICSVRFIGSNEKYMQWHRDEEQNQYRINNLHQSLSSPVTSFWKSPGLSPIMEAKTVMQNSNKIEKNTRNRQEILQKSDRK